MSEFLFKALKRDRELQRPAWPMELHSSYDHVFRCELCNRLRRDEQRREPDSEICIKCVEEAGFFEDQ